MKVNLNIKAQNKGPIGSFPAVPVLLAIVTVISIIWLWSLNSSRIEIQGRINTLQAKTAEARKAIGTAKAVTNKTAQDKLSISKAVLDSLQGRIQSAMSFSGRKTSVFGFFHGLESAVRGDSFITRVTSDPKGNLFSVEGFSLNADNITEVVKNLQSQPNFSSVTLKEIVGDEVSKQKSLKFILTFNYSDGGILDFSPVEPTAIQQIKK